MFRTNSQEGFMVRKQIIYIYNKHFRLDLHNKHAKGFYISVSDKHGINARNWWKIQFPPTWTGSGWSVYLVAIIFCRSPEFLTILRGFSLLKSILLVAKCTITFNLNSFMLFENFLTWSVCYWYRQKGDRQGCCTHGLAFTQEPRLGTNRMLSWIKHTGIGCVPQCAEHITRKQ